ncbi:MAG: TatD family hydrolase [Woeseiaceae bacterium]|nr:TatD family hydrolase [Woeseiaceae bacterium]
MTDRPVLIDIGANLTHDSFDADRDAVLARAADAGVVQLVVTGSSEATSRDAQALAARYPGRLFASAGVHPHHASDYSDRVHATLTALADDDAVVAIGECGLDYFRDFSPRATQRAAFTRQLELAAAKQLPVFLHQRDAHDDFVEALEPWTGRLTRAVAHCFTGDAGMLRDYVELGLYIGVTGWVCDERRGRALYDAIASIPSDRLMIETDAPYLLPRTLRPKPKTRRNEPAWLPEVLRVVAEAAGRDARDIAHETTANARRFFGLPEPA